MVHQTATPDYTRGFSERALAAPMRRTAESNAAYLLPYLVPGLRVLDFGCGPGSLSMGIASYISPGELHGVDMEESLIEIARTKASQTGQSNAIFHVGDATVLPFEDGFFDIAHGHNILMHVPDTRALLTEVKRVLKPGGIIACREMICESAFAHPDLGIARRLWELFEDLVATNDGHPQMGKEMKTHILDAGFTDIRMSASFTTYSTPQEINYVRHEMLEWLMSPEITDAAIKYGAWTEDLSDNIRAIGDKWVERPDAFAGTAYGEAIAVKP